MSYVDAKGNTLLHRSIIKGDNFYLIMNLLDRGADIHAKNHENYEPLHVAIQHNRTEAASLLIQRGALVKENLNSLLTMAIEKENFTITKMLIDHGMQCNLSIDLEIFNAAIAQRQSEILDYIIPHCQFLTSSNRFIPREFVTNDAKSSESQYKECIKVLLKWNFTVNPNCCHDTDFIFAAVKRGYSQIVLQLLKLGINVDMVHPIKKTNLLAIGCENKRHQVVEILLQHNADINMVMPLNYKNYLHSITCLQIAICNSDLVMTEMLLRYGANVKCTNFHQQTPLHFCVSSDSNEKDSKYNIAKLLLENGASIHLQTPNNDLLFNAINNGHCKIAQLFLNYNPNIKYYSSDDDTPLHKAIENGFDVEFIKTLLKSNLPVDAVNNKGLTPLLVACKNQPSSKLEIIEVLLHYNADVNCTDDELMTSLHLACDAQHLKLIKILLENGANVNATTGSGHTPLHRSCKYRNETTSKIIQLLLEYGANTEATDATGCTPLFIACDCKNDVAVKYLLENRANPNAKNFQGLTPLHTVCKYSCETTPKIIQLLLEHGANIEATVAKGWTPLLEACCAGNDVAVKCLLENHANPNAKNFQGLTPLHIICKYKCDRSPKIIQLLLQHNANIEAVNTKGWTPLFIACDNTMGERDSVVECLLIHGANPNHTDSKCSTPLHIAVKKEFTMIIEALIKYGANINIPHGGKGTLFQDLIENIILSFKVNSNETHSYHWINERMIKVLLSQGIKLKAAGLMENNHTSNIASNFDRCIDIDTVNFSAIDILQLNVPSNVSNNIFRNIYYYKDIRLLEPICKQEIEKMKTESIGIDGMTFYDLLKRNIHRRSTLMESTKLQQTLKQNIYYEKFPLYIHIIRNRLRDAKLQYKLRKSAREYVRLNVYSRLPDECIDAVLDYLNINELKMFVKSIRAF